MEASVVVCERLKPPRLCHTENQPEVRKTATPKTSTRCARGAMRGAHGAFVSLSGFIPNPPPPPDLTANNISRSHNRHALDTSCPAQ